MSLEQIEAEVLKLPEQARVELLDRLMRSLVETSAMEPAVAEAWMEEAVRRDEELELGHAAGLPAEEVFEALRNKGK
jgi:putative addiction module component (TIGR02574 family)